MAWFFRAEIQFRLRRITSNTTKSDMILEAMPQDVFSRISSWLMSFPNHIPYEELKEGLMNRFCMTPSTRAAQVIASSRQPIGDQRVHASYNQFQALARLPTTTGAQPKELDMLRELWLLKLPQPIRAALPNASTMPLDDLLDQADALMEANKASNHHQPVFAANSTASANTASPNASADEHLDTDDSAAPAQWKRPATDRWRRQPTAQRQHRTLPDICYYHAKFGQKARNCEEPCKFSKNGPGGPLGRRGPQLQ